MRRRRVTSGAVVVRGDAFGVRCGADAWCRRCSRTSSTGGTISRSVKQAIIRPGRIDGRPVPVRVRRARNRQGGRNPRRTTRPQSRSRRSQPRRVVEKLEKSSCTLKKSESNLGRASRRSLWICTKLELARKTVTFQTRNKRRRVTNRNTHFREIRETVDESRTSM